MTTKLISPIEDSEWQSVTTSLDIGDESKRVSIDFIYSDKTNTWYMSMSDLQTEKQYFNMVPLLASYGDTYNNLWEPFKYKGIGVFYCVPKSDSPSTQNPSKENLNEFYLIWGDGIE